MADTSSKSTASNPNTRAGKIEIQRDQNATNPNTPQGRMALAQKAVEENQAAGLRQDALAGQGGGRGIVGGPYGVRITNESAVGGRQGTRTNQTNVTDWNAKETEFIASLKTNAGIIAPSTIAEARDPNNPYNKAISDWERGNNLTRDKAAQDQALSESYFASQHPTSDKAAREIFNAKPTSYDQNYGYSQNIKPSDIITKGFTKNPTDVTFTVTPAGQRQIDFYQASHGTNYGGVETKQSQGKSYGSEWTSKQSQSIGEKIFSNQPVLVRNSPFENKVKTKEAERASQVYPSFANKDYVTGGKKEEAPVVTLGKAQGFFGNKTTFGWESVSKDQLVRGSTKEKLATSGIGVLSTPSSQFGTAFETKGELVDKNAKGSDVFQAVKTGQGTVTVLKQPEPQQTTTANTLSDKDFRNLLTTEENQGAVFSIFAGGKKVSETSGPRAYHDYLAAQKQYGNNVLISATYPEAEKNIISNVRKNPDFYAKQPSSYWQNLGEKGYLTSKGMSQVNLILRQNWFKETQPIRDQDKAFRQNLSDITNAGLGFNIKDKSGNVVATTQGPRAYHDYLAAQKQYGKDVTIEPKYEWSIGDYFNKTLLAQPKSTPSGKPEEIIPGLITSGKSMAANIYALGLSTVQFAQKPDKSLNLGFGAKIPYSEQARQNVIGSLTFGIEPSKLLEGKIAYNQNIKLSQEGQKISEANKESSYTNVQLGLEKPTKSTEYYSGGALLTGIMAGAMVYGLKDIVPIKTTTFPLPYAEGVKPARAITFGTGGESDIILGGRGGGKFFRGQPKAENLNLNKLAPTTSREGFESGTGTPLQNKIITEVAVPGLEKSGKLSKTGTLDILETGKEGSKLATAAPTIQFRGFGEKPFRSLTPEQTPILLNFLKEKKFTVTGSTAEIPFTKEGFVSQARDVDIKGIKKEKAVKFSEELAGRLQEKALPGQTFEAKGTSVVLTTKDAGLIGQPPVESKILEFPQHEIQQGYGLTEEEKSFVFGTRVPSEKTKVEGLKTVTYDYQGLRKLASSTELHIGGRGDIIVRASSGREVKDPAHVFSYYKTKASNYIAVGKTEEGERLNQIAENYRSRHPELDFSKEYRSVNAPGTLELSQKPSVLSNIGSLASRNISSGFSKSSKISSSSYGYAISSRDLVSLRGSSASANKSKSSSFSVDMTKSKSLSSAISKSREGKYDSSKLSSRGGTSSKLGLLSSKNSSVFSSKTSSGGLPSKSPGSKTSLLTPSGKQSLTLTSLGTITSTKTPLASSNTSPPPPLSTSNTFNPKPLLPHGNLGLRRRNKSKEGPTALLNLGVNNIFASGLSITVAKNRRYEF